jgi:hypothetical protein
MTAFLSARQIRIFDYPRFAEPLRDRVRERAAELARAAGITIEHIAKSHIRKEDVVAKVLAVRGDHPGLVHIISAMEACDSYKPWHDKRTHRTFLRPDSGKCLHYYFYFIDAELGLIYLRVQSRCHERTAPVFTHAGHLNLARVGPPALPGCWGASACLPIVVMCQDAGAIIGRPQEALTNLRSTGTGLRKRSSIGQWASTAAANSS